jgi:glycosyltransferase involved in cell wall biosynthesis
MKIQIFGSGPMPCETDFSVMAPGARTWQILQTVVNALSNARQNASVTVFGLEAQTRSKRTVEVPISADRNSSNFSIVYYPLGIEDFRKLSESKNSMIGEPPELVIGCASLQPCSTASLIARQANAPFWADVFGDPFAELQSKAQIEADQREAVEQLYSFAWQLYLPVLLTADHFSTLSGRQRFALIGQLGAAGRLNRHTTGQDIVTNIAYGIFPADVPKIPAPPAEGRFTALWSGSFNTWMDVDTLVRGIQLSVKQNPSIKIIVAGGKIDGYNERPYGEFVKAVNEAQLMMNVELIGWQSLARMRDLYSSCHCGISIDRYTYEAVLGSRTRILNFLAAGRPVLSTNETELVDDLVEQGFVIPFGTGDPESMAEALVKASQRKEELLKVGDEAREYVTARYHGEIVGNKLARWVVAPIRAGDRNPGAEAGPLSEFWNEQFADFNKSK